jgi:hypothetical protein
MKSVWRRKFLRIQRVTMPRVLRMRHHTVNPSRLAVASHVGRKGPSQPVRVQFYSTTYACKRVPRRRRAHRQSPATATVLRGESCVRTIPCTTHLPVSPVHNYSFSVIFGLAAMHCRRMMRRPVPHHRASKTLRRTDPAIWYPAPEDRAYVLSMPADTAEMGLAVQVSMSGRRQSGKCKWPPRRRVQDEGAHVPPADPPPSPTPDQKIAALQPSTQWPLRLSPLSRRSQCSVRRLRPRRCQWTARCRTQAPAMKIPTAHPSATSGTRSAAVNTGARIATVASRSTGMRS